MSDAITNVGILNESLTNSINSLDSSVSAEFNDLDASLTASLTNVLESTDNLNEKFENYLSQFNFDSFFRLRVSEPYTQYEYNFQYNKAPLIWAEKVAGSGTGTHLPNESSIKLTTGISPTASQDKGFGYFDADNGVYIARDSGGTYVNLRAKVTGIVANRKVYQNAWNYDKLDGNGPSGLTADWSKTFIFLSDVEWLGVGTVVIALVINRKPYIIHMYHNSQVLETAYMTTANLPMRYFISDGAHSIIRQTFQYFRYRPGKSLLILATGNLNADLNYMTQICATVITESGNDQESYYQHSVDRGISLRSITTTQNALISIRPKATFNSIVNRAQIIHEAIDLIVPGTGTVLWKLIYNPTLGGSPSWASAGDNAIFEFDIAGSTITGGEIVASGYASSTATGKQRISSELSAKYPLTLDIDGLNPKILTLAATATTGTVDCLASMTAREYY